MPKKRLQEGFSVVEALIVLFVLALVGFSAWFVSGKRNVAGNKTSPITAKVTPSSPATMTSNFWLSDKDPTYLRVQYNNSWVFYQRALLKPVGKTVYKINFQNTYTDDYLSRNLGDNAYAGGATVYKTTDSAFGELFILDTHGDAGSYNDTDSISISGCDPAKMTACSIKLQNGDYLLVTVGRHVEEAQYGVGINLSQSVDKQILDEAVQIISTLKELPLPSSN